MLNRSYFSEGVVKLSPEVITELSKRMSGSNNPFHGKTHSLEQRELMSLGHTNRIEVYKYTLDYIYTGDKANSLQKAKDIGAKFTGVQRVVATGGTHRGFRFSSLPPILDVNSNQWVLPAEGRVQDPLKGTGSHLFEPLKVTRKDSLAVQYFVSLRRAVAIIREGSV